MALLTLPVFAALCFVVSSLYQDVAFAAREREGVVGARQHWVKINGNSPAAAPARATLRQLLDESYLILDPTLDAYNLMDAICLELPNLNIYSPVPADTKAALARITRSAQAAVKEDENFFAAQPLSPSPSPPRHPPILKLDHHRRCKIGRPRRSSRRRGLRRYRPHRT